MEDELMTWQEVWDYCDRHRESDGFCSISCGCSGPTYSNLACDYEDERPGIAILRGGNYGSCYFEVKDDRE